MGSQQEHNVLTEDELRRRRVAQQQAELRKTANKTAGELDSKIEAVLGCTPALFSSMTLQDLVHIRNQSQRVFQLFDDILSNK